MEEDFLDRLDSIKHRLYCVWQAVEHGDTQMYTHSESLGFVLCEIWNELDDMLRKSSKIDILKGNDDGMDKS